MRNIVILNSLHFSYPLPILMRVSYNTLIVKQNTSDYYKYNKIMAHHQLDELDEKILKLIIGNARMPFLEVARECNVSGAAIHQRIQKLTNLGVIKGSEFIVDNTKVGYETCAYMGLFLKSPGQFPSVTEALKQIPEVVECHYTTGQYDLFIKIYAKNNQHLLNIIHNKLQPLGLARTESLISFKEAFKRQIPIDLDDE